MLPFNLEPSVFTPAFKELKNYNIEDYNFYYGCAYMWNMVSEKWTEGVWEQGAEDNNWTEEGWSDGWVEKTA
jgi:hypothetical protein